MWGLRVVVNVNYIDVQEKGTLLRPASSSPTVNYGSASKRNCHMPHAMLGVWRSTPAPPDVCGKMASEVLRVAISIPGTLK